MCSAAVAFSKNDPSDVWNDLGVVAPSVTAKSASSALPSIDVLENLYEVGAAAISMTVTSIASNFFPTDPSDVWNDTGVAVPVVVPMASGFSISVTVIPQLPKSEWHISVLKGKNCRRFPEHYLETMLAMAGLNNLTKTAIQ